MSSLRWSEEQLAEHNARTRRTVAAPAFVELQDEPGPHDSERDHQAAVFRWAAKNLHVLPKLQWLYAIPNGAKRTVGERATALSTGLKKGVPDMCLPVRTVRWAGLYIEMKAPNRGEPTPHQREWLEGLQGNGYLTAICRSYRDARKLLIEYLSN